MTSRHRAAVGWSVHHAIVDDVLHQQRQQAFARMEGMSYVELLALREICGQIDEMTNVAITSCEARSGN